MTIEEVINEMEDNKKVEDSKSQPTMNIHQKLTYIQNDLLRESIPKNGKNPFGNFTYYELEDLLPPILRLCKKYGCTLYFNFPLTEDDEKKAILNLINWEDTSDCIRIITPLPPLEKLPKMNYVQSLGTYQTYMKRYLILHTFGIVEKEIIDSGFVEEQTKKQDKKTKTTKKDKPSKVEQKDTNTKVEKKDKPKTKTEKPESLQKVIDKCHELHSEKECDKKLLNKVSLKMFNDKELTLDERKEVFNYIKTLK